MKSQTIADLPKDKILRQEKWTFNIPKIGMYFYDSVIAVDITEAFEKIKEKYPEANYFQPAGPPKLIQSGWHPNRTGYEPSEFAVKMMEALGAGW